MNHRNVSSRINSNWLHQIGWFLILCVCYSQNKVCIKENYKETESVIFSNSATVHYPWETEAGMNTETIFSCNLENIHQNKLYIHKFQQKYYSRTGPNWNTYTGSTSLQIKKEFLNKMKMTTQTRYD